MIAAARSGTRASPSKVGFQFPSSEFCVHFANSLLQLALRDFEVKELAYVKQLDEVIAGKLGEEINVSKLFNFFSFDVMSDLAFGAPFQMLQTQKEHFALQILHDGQSLLSFITPVPWLAIILRRIPGALEGERRLVEWSMEQVTKRRQVSRSKPTQARKTSVADT